MSEPQQKLKGVAYLMSWARPLAWFLMIIVGLYAAEKLIRLDYFGAYMTVLFFGQPIWILFFASWVYEKNSKG